LRQCGLAHLVLTYAALPQGHRELEAASSDEPLSDVFFWSVVVVRVVASDWLSVPKTSSLCIFRSLEPSVRTLTPLKWRSVLTVKLNVINCPLKTRSIMQERQGAEREVQCLLKIGILARDRGAAVKPRIVLHCIGGSSGVYDYHFIWKGTARSAPWLYGQLESATPCRLSNSAPIEASRTAGPVTRRLTYETTAWL